MTKGTSGCMRWDEALENSGNPDPVIRDSMVRAGSDGSAETTTSMPC